MILLLIPNFLVFFFYNLDEMTNKHSFIAEFKLGSGNLNVPKIRTSFRLNLFKDKCKKKCKGKI